MYEFLVKVGRVVAIGLLGQTGSETQYYRFGLSLFVICCVGLLIIIACSPYAIKEIKKK